MDYARRIKNMILGVREFNRESTKTLDKYGTQRIVDMRVCRIPIRKELDYVLNAISLGKWTEARRNYDELFHLFMEVELEDGTHVLIEKNEQVRITTNVARQGVGVGGKEEQYIIYLPNHDDITLIELIMRTLENIGGDNFHIYNAFSFNCQRFLIDILSSNDLLTPQLKHFIFQDIGEIVEKLPEYTQTIAKTVTNLMNIFDVITGKGKKITLRRKKKKNNKKR
jgi:hypothetical protein